MSELEKVHQDHFYLNLVVLNKESILKGKVKEKAGAGVFGRLAGTAANAVISDAKVSSTLSAGLVEKLESVTREMGLRLAFQKSFQRKNFIVIKVTLLHIDKVTLLKNIKGREFAEKFEVLVGTMKELELEDRIKEIELGMGDKVIEKLMEKLQEVLPDKLHEQGVQCDVNTVSPEHQADLFFAALNELGIVESS